MDASELAREYREQYYHSYEALSPRIKELIGQFVKDKGIPIAQIESRTKTVESFQRKIERKSYKDPFTEIKDFAGIRVVCYYADDVARIAELLRDEFEVDSEHSTNKVEDLAIDEFGYRSFHLVCSIKEPRASLAEWRSVAELQFEIQVRSVLQHAWAAISHKLDYKNASQAPHDIRRRLFRLSALLELADDQFDLIRDISQEISAGYRSDVEKGDLSLPLDLDSLSTYVGEKVDLRKWEQLGLESGLRPDLKIDFGSNVGAEKESELNRARIQFFLAILQAMGLTLVSEVDALIHKHVSKAPQIIKKVAVASKKHGFLMRASGLDVIAVTLAIAERNRLPRGFSWPEPWVDGIRGAMDELLSLKKSEEGSSSSEKGKKDKRINPADP